MNLEKLLGDLGLSGSVGAKLLDELENQGKAIAAGEVAKLAARGLVKGIDAMAAAAVKHLGPNDTVALMDAYALALEAQFRQLAEAAAEYTPLALNVESHKEKFGKNSPEANTARKNREAGMNELRSEVRDLLLTAVGGEAGD